MFYQFKCITWNSACHQLQIYIYLCIYTHIVLLSEVAMEWRTNKVTDYLYVVLCGKIPRFLLYLSVISSLLILHIPDLQLYKHLFKFRNAWFMDLINCFMSKNGPSKYGTVDRVQNQSILSLLYCHQNCLELTLCLSFIKKSGVFLNISCTFWTHGHAIRYRNNAVTGEMDREQILH